MQQKPTVTFYNVLSQNSIKAAYTRTQAGAGVGGALGVIISDAVNDHHAAKLDNSLSTIRTNLLKHPLNSQIIDHLRATLEGARWVERRGHSPLTRHARSRTRTFTETYIIGISNFKYLLDDDLSTLCTQLQVTLYPQNEAGTHIFKKE